jgi:hypothetical protein
MEKKRRRRGEGRFKKTVYKTIHIFNMKVNMSRYFNLHLFRGKKVSEKIIK